jgi:peptidoglycan lytic transglycosylase
MMPVFGLASGLTMMALALTASAKDGAPASDSAATPIQPARTVASTQSTGAKAGFRSRLKARRWLEVGIASWYGLRFQGRQTAGGEIYDMNTMTCAHPTLPMGTWLRVTNLKNRRTAFVRVNDRGPVVDGRIVDLSYAAAQAVGLSGVGRVKLESVGEGDPDLNRALVAQMQIPIRFNVLVPMTP